MRGPATRSSRGRSIGAVLAGFLVTAGLSLATDAVMHATGVFPGWGQPMSDGVLSNNSIEASAAAGMDDRSLA